MYVFNEPQPVGERDFRKQIGISMNELGPQAKGLVAAIVVLCSMLLVMKAMAQNMDIDFSMQVRLQDAISTESSGLGESEPLDKRKILLLACTRHTEPFIRIFGANLSPPMEVDVIDLTIEDPKVTFEDYALVFVEFSKRKGVVNCREEFKVLPSMITIAEAGEVFDMGVRCNPRMDIVLDRMKNRHYFGPTNCEVVPYLQAVSFQSKNEKDIGKALGAAFDLERLCEQTRPRVHANRDRPFDVLLVISKLIKSVHFADALVRAALAEIISEDTDLKVAGSDRWVSDLRGHENISPLKCSGIDIVNPCKAEARFTIDSENFFAPGYVSEKIVTGLLEGGIPIYSGGNDEVSRIFNKERLILCELPNEEVLKEFRTFKKLHKKDFIFPDGNKISLSEDPQEKPFDRLLDATVKFWRPHLKKCVAEIQEVATDDELYQRKATAQIFSDEMQERYCTNPKPTKLKYSVTLGTEDSLGRAVEKIAKRRNITIHL